jgi:4-amino-4-deoxy-L-arabinose transferase-like glycosyltransferase
MFIKPNKDVPFFLCILFIFVVNLFLHLYRLGNIPYSIHIDEAGLWYNVQSLIKYGTDQAGNSLPLLFANYHSEQSAMYTYIAVICFKLFGESLFALRLPAVLNAVTIFIFGNKIVWKLYQNKYVTIVFSVLVTLCPYFIMSERMALDCNLMLGLITMFLWFFLQAVENQKTTSAIIAGIICGFTLYTYALSYISLPIFLIISLSYLCITKKITWKQILAFSVPLILLAIPLILIQAINIFDLQEIEIGLITLPKFNNPRHDDLSFLSILSNFVMPLLYILFTPQRPYECVAIYGNFQWILAPFMLIGIILNIVQLFRHSTLTDKKLLTLWWMSGYFAGLLIYKDLTTWHLNGIMLISLIFAIDGVIFCFKKIKQTSTKNINNMFIHNEPTIDSSTILNL